MRRATLILWTVIAIASAAAPAQASLFGGKPRPTPTPSPTYAPLPQPSPAIAAIARREFLAWQLGSIDRSRYVPQMADALSAEQVQKVSSELARLGALKDAVFVNYAKVDALPPTAVTYVYHMLCENGAVYMLFSLDGHGIIQFIQYRDTLSS